MASFATVTQGVRCAVALQQRFEEWNRQAGKGQASMSVRIGLNAGEPIEEDGDLFGSSVILAARIASSARAGEIRVSNAVRDLAMGKGFNFERPTEIDARGFDEPVRVWTVCWRQSSENTRTVDQR
jgi:adenylate cyclase